MRTFEQILVPVDFGPASYGALQQAAFLARRLGARIDVMHVWEPERAHWICGEPVDDRLPGFERSEPGRAMNELLSHFEGERGRCCHGRLESGDPSSTILRVAEEEGYNLIVMGINGRTAISDLLLGTVPSTVVRLARCPVLTVRASSAHWPSAKKPDTQPRDWDSLTPIRGG
jgi:nucleotide-binding universal stress UspA family protein